MIGIWLWVAVCPPLEVMKQAAVTAYDVDGRTLAQMARSLRVRHVLPTLAVRAWHVDTVLDDVSTTSLHSGWGIEGRMELQLSQLVFTIARSICSAKNCVPRTCVWKSCEVFRKITSNTYQCGRSTPPRLSSDCVKWWRLSTR